MNQAVTNILLFPLNNSYVLGETLFLKFYHKNERVVNLRWQNFFLRFTRGRLGRFYLGFRCGGHGSFGLYWYLIWGDSDVRGWHLLVEWLDDNAVRRSVHI